MRGLFLLEAGNHCFSFLQKLFEFSEKIAQQRLSGRPSPDSFDILDSAGQGSRFIQKVEVEIEKLFLLVC